MTKPPKRDTTPTFAYSAWLRNMSNRAKERDRLSIDNIDVKAIGRVADRLDELSRRSNYAAKAVKELQVKLEAAGVVEEQGV